MLNCIIKYRLISYHRRFINLALLQLLLLFKKAIPNLFCKKSNIYSNCNSRSLRTVLKAPHIHSKAKNQFGISKYTTVLNINYSLCYKFIPVITYKLIFSFIHFLLVTSSRLSYTIVNPYRIINYL